MGLALIDQVARDLSYLGCAGGDLREDGRALVVADALELAAELSPEASDQLAVFTLRLEAEMPEAAVLVEQAEPEFDGGAVP